MNQLGVALKYFTRSWTFVHILTVVGDLSVTHCGDLLSWLLFLCISFEGIYITLTSMSTVSLTFVAGCKICDQHECYLLSVMAKSMPGPLLIRLQQAFRSALTIVPLMHRYDGMLKCCSLDCRFEWPKGVKWRGWSSKNKINERKRTKQKTFLCLFTLKNDDSE